jgi:hypothetical protein
VLFGTLGEVISPKPRPAVSSETLSAQCAGGSGSSCLGDLRLEDARLAHVFGGDRTQLDVGRLQYLGDPNSPNTAYTGRQYTRVESIATCGTRRVNITGAGRCMGDPAETRVLR